MCANGELFSMDQPGNPNARGVRRDSRLRIINQTTAENDRRSFLRTFAAYGVALPAAHLFSGGMPSAPVQDGTLAPSSDAEGNARSIRVVRDFVNPRLEAVRLLREAAEIEHSLMLQYLYAAYSLKPAYQTLIGTGAPNTTDLVGVSVQEMQHLMDVNRLLVELGAGPVFVRQDFPYEPEIYPFALNLEPLSRKSLAKYTFCEAPSQALDRAQAQSPNDLAFIDALESILAGEARMNHVGSLYGAVITTVRELARQPGELQSSDKWIDRLTAIKNEGEEGHFKFFKSLFMASHKVFENQRNIWQLSPNDQRYPVIQLPTNPSAYIGADNQIGDPTLRNIAWLGNLHYWLCLMLLDVGYRSDSAPHRAASKTIMMGPFWVLVRFLPSRGAGMPFDQLSTGYSTGLDQRQNEKFIAALVSEIEIWESRLKNDLPSDYSSGIAKQAVDLTSPGRPGSTPARGEL
jgi:hypothetical protein